MPRSTSTVMKPQTLTPERFFQLSPAHVSLYFSPGARDRMERPHELAGVHVPRAHVAGRALRRILLRAAAGDDQVPVDRRRRAEAVAARQALQDLRRVQVDDAAVAEFRHWARRFRVERVQSAAARAEDDLRRRVCASPGQYSTPRVDGLPAGSWKFHISLPVVGSSATTRPYGVVRYIDAVDDERRRLARGESRAAAAAAAPLPCAAAPA